MTSIGVLIFALAIGQFGAAFPEKNYAPTPQRAVLAVFGSPNVRVIRTNVAGRYATILTRGAIVEGASLKSAVILERFAFGWQTIDLLDSRCSLDREGISARDKSALMIGMPTERENRLCFGHSEDAGPPADIEALRLRMTSVFVPWVRVSGEFALAQWFGGGGGQTLFKKSNGEWHQIAGGGGAHNAVELTQLGVPHAAQCFFHVYDASCPPLGGRAISLASISHGRVTVENQTDKKVIVIVDRTPPKRDTFVVAPHSTGHSRNEGDSQYEIVSAQIIDDHSSKVLQEPRVTLGPTKIDYSFCVSWHGEYYLIDKCPSKQARAKRPLLR